ncbi:MAG: HAMP domain-containing histidine kinase, partial [Proteobacteria bacterium]
ALIRNQKAADAALAQTELAHQVAHDIRSPLLALEMLLKEVADFLPEHQNLVRSATTRIRDIANDLVSKGLEKNGDFKSAEIDSLLVLPALQSILSEKRLQFREQLGLRFELVVEPGSAGSFIQANQIEFSRVFSNLLNNAAESMKEGTITVFVKRDGELVSIGVRDSGKGIEESILPTLGQRGVSIGKRGSGLGLFHARQCASKWLGTLEIKSTLGGGTIVTLIVPLSPTPLWLQDDVTFNQGDIPVILDDEVSVFRAWERLLPKTPLGLPVFLTSKDAFRAWHSKRDKNKNYVYFFDYEIGRTESGVQLINELSIGNNAILVTSRYDDRAVQKQAIAAGIKILPKDILQFTDFRILSNPHEAYADLTVFVDDDESNRRVWEISARKANKSLLCFGDAETLMKAKKDLPLETRFFIDFSLGGGKDESLNLISELCGLGYRDIFLCTGYPKEAIQNIPGIKGIVGKTPPWLR